MFHINYLQNNNKAHNVVLFLSMKLEYVLKARLKKNTFTFVLFVQNKKVAIFM